MILENENEILNYHLHLSPQQFSNVHRQVFDVKLSIVYQSLYFLFSDARVVPFHLTITLFLRRTAMWFLILCSFLSLLCLIVALPLPTELCICCTWRINNLTVVVNPMVNSLHLGKLIQHSVLLCNNSETNIYGLRFAKIN